MRWWQWWVGEVDFRCEGGLCERFLSLLTEQEGVAIRRVRTTDGCVTATCRAADYRKVRRPARRTGTRVRAVKRHGVSFRLRRFRRRPGLLIGAASALLVYMVLASCIWVVDVRTEDPALRDAVERELAACGVAVGAPARNADLPAVRMRVIAGVEELHQMSVYLEGCVAHVDIRWQEEGAARPDSTPANVLAACDGQILSMRVTDGQAMVKTGDAVVAGDLLVCGAIETEQGVLLRRAAATVTARTERRFSVTVSRAQALELDGRVIVQPTVQLLWWSIPCYSPTAFSESYEVSTERSAVRWMDTPLPLGIRQTVYTERRLREQVFTDDQMKTIAKARLQAQAAAAIGAATVERVDYEEQWTDAGYTLCGRYICVEDIAVQTPLLSDFE